MLEHRLTLGWSLPVLGYCSPLMLKYPITQCFDPAFGDLVVNVARLAAVRDAGKIQVANPSAEGILTGSLCENGG